MEHRRILFLSSWYPNRTKPTNGDFVQRHAQAVAGIHSVVALHVVHDPELRDKRVVEKHSFQGVQEYIVYFSAKGIARFFKAFIIIGLYLKMTKQIQAEQGKFDIIHANVFNPICLVAYILHRVHRIPFIITEHWTGFLPSTQVSLNFLTMSLIRFIAKRASFITPVSMNLQESMQKLSIKGKYSVINNVVDTSIFKPSDANRSEKIHILHVSTLKNEHKNYKGILEGLKIVLAARTDFVLDVVSEKPGDDLLRYAQELGISEYVHFHGYKNRTEMAAMMQKSGFLLLFSNYENFPCVIVEAFAAGLPVLSTRVGGIAEHLDNTKGRLIALGNVTELSETLLWFFDNLNTFDKELLSKYAQENFSYEAVARSIDYLYSGI